jgi:hypothetical protein
MLEMQAKQLEGIVGVMTGGEDSGGDTEEVNTRSLTSHEERGDAPPDPKKAAIQKEQEMAKVLEVAPSDKIMPGLSSKTVYDRPVLCGVASSDKKRKGGTHEFRDILSKQGILFSCEKPSLVKAIERGTVIFRGRMPGYGEVVILHHGDRFYTLYALLRNIRVQKGDFLEAGQAISEIAPDSEGEKGKYSFYIEVRKNGKPEPASRYFSWK